MTASTYKKLPGRKRGLIATATLWEADDHMLLVDSYWVTESYRRFNYHDIRSIVICETKTGLVVSIILALIGLFFAIIAIAVSRETGIVLGIVAAPFFVLSLIGFLNGPTCRCALQTQVQTHEITPLNRLRKARLALSRLQPRIAAAQQAPAPQ